MLELPDKGLLGVDDKNCSICSRFYIIPNADHPMTDGSTVRLPFFGPDSLDMTYSGRIK